MMQTWCSNYRVRYTQVLGTKLHQDQISIINMINEREYYKTNQDY